MSDNPMNEAMDNDVVIPRQLFDFLMGTGEIDGTAFDELNEGLGPFWWRTLLACAERESPTRKQAAIAAFLRAAPVSEGMIKVGLLEYEGEYALVNSVLCDGMRNAAIAINTQLADEIEGMSNGQ